MNYKTCLICDKKFPSPPSADTVCCSPKCSSIHRQQMQENGVYDKVNEKWLKARDMYTKTHKGEKHHHSKYWKLQAPDGEVYEVVNLMYFIKENIELFNGSTPKQAFDGICKIKASQQGKRKRPSYSYKGWKLLSSEDKKTE